MNTREYFTQCFKAEVPKFVAVLKAVPPEAAGYRPHPRSMSAAEIVSLLANELGDAVTVLDKGEVAFVQAPPPPNLADSIALYEKNAAAVKRRIAKVKDSGWRKPARFLMDGKVVWKAPLGDMLWGFLFDAIHHRGQLSTYLRPMGAKVPSIYGPSADDPGK
ncbi:MAG TPA: DinB family protein [Thermoanaerobaculia bacterium]|nr:DinB family protein [Thermoanaerobaculia bacterium]